MTPEESLKEFYLTTYNNGYRTGCADGFTSGVEACIQVLKQKKNPCVVEYVDRLQSLIPAEVEKHG